MTQGVSPPTWLDDFFASGYTTIQVGSTLFPREPILSLQGAGISATDDPTNSRTIVTIIGGGTGSTTTTTAAFSQPNVGSTVNVPVTSSASFAVGLVAFVANGGYYSVTAVPDGTHITIENLGVTGNASPPTSIPSGSLVVPTGPANQVFVQGDGVAVTPRSTLDFIGFSVADDATNARTTITNTTGAPVTASGGVHMMQPGETWGLINPGETWTFPAVPVVGQTLEFTTISSGFSSGSPATFNGNGKNVCNPQATYTNAPTVPGTTENVTYRFRYDGTIYRCVN